MKASTAIVCLSAALLVLIFCSVTVEAKAVLQTSANGDHERFQRDLAGLFEALTNGLKDVFTPHPETGESKLGNAAKQVMGLMGGMLGKSRK